MTLEYPGLFFINFVCHILGGIVSLGLDEEGLSQYVELFTELQSVDAVLERIVGSGTIPNGILDACDISAYITSTSKYIYSYNVSCIIMYTTFSDNLEILFEAMDGTDPSVCFIAADNLSEFVNGQGDGTVSEIVPDPVLSFLTAASSLEQEASTPAGGSGAARILPPVLLILSILLAVFIA